VEHCSLTIVKFSRYYGHNFINKLINAEKKKLKLYLKLLITLLNVKNKKLLITLLNVKNKKLLISLLNVKNKKLLITLLNVKNKNIFYTHLKKSLDFLSFINEII
jgi:hypothetical protein